jgi:hypothetical protein
MRRKDLFTWDVVKRGFWFCLVATFFYFGVKAPIMYLFTSIMGINYIVGGFLAGVIVTVGSFLLTEFGIYKPKKKVAVL